MVTAILIGAGDRGSGVYGQWALKNKNKIRFVAVAEPRSVRRKKFATAHGLSEGNCFESWEDILGQDKMADICFVATQDQMHTAPVLKALELGYHVMVEKPMATTPEECYRMINIAEQSGKQLWVAHVLRYTPFFSTIKRVVDEGRIGRITNINHSENVSYWHFAHSYVRGNWSRSEESSPMILAKTCHDLDIIHWLVGSPVKKLSSFGGLNFYRKENAPEGAALRCLDNCALKENCQWYAPRLYGRAEPLLQVGLRSRYFYKRLVARIALDCPLIIRLASMIYRPLKTLVEWDMWPVSVITDDCSKEGKERALKEGPYGRCVFHCDNDVCDNQIVSMEFDNGVKATLTVHGFASSEGRWIRIEGTKGTLLGKFTAENQEIATYDHHNVKKRILMKTDLSLAGHLGGDDGIMKSLIQSLEEEKNNKISKVLTSAKASLESHLMAFAAEISRKKDKILIMDELREYSGGAEKGFAV